MEAVCAECQINKTAANKRHETRRRERRLQLGTPDLEGSETLDQQQKSSWVRRSLHSRGFKIWTNYNRIFCFSSDDLIAQKSKAEQQEKQGKKQNSVSNIQMPGGCTTQVLAQLWLIFGTHAPVNRRPEHILNLQTRYLNHTYRNLQMSWANKGTLESPSPTCLRPQSHCSMSAEGPVISWQPVSFPDHVLLQLASNDSASPEHICTDRWCKRTRITLTASEKLVWNANIVWRRVKQGKSGSVSLQSDCHTQNEMYSQAVKLPRKSPTILLPGCPGCHTVFMYLSGWTPCKWRKTSHFSLDTRHPALSVLEKCVRWELIN